MKLNYLSRLTALLLAVLLLGTSAAGASSIDLGDLTGGALVNMDSAAAMVEAGYCATCADELAGRGVTVWPASGYTCLYTQLASISASQAYDLLAPLAAGTYEEQDLYWAYINIHNRHYYDDSANYPLVICWEDNCSKFVQYSPVEPGAANHDETCPWHDEEYTQAVAGLNPVYGEDGVTIESYILMLKNANGELVTVATSKILDGKYHYFMDVNTGLYVAYLHTDEAGTQWIIPLPSEKEVATETK